jgi:hypothetical protein
MASLKNPMHYGAALIKTRMALELGPNPGVDFVNPYFGRKAFGYIFT